MTAVFVNGNPETAAIWDPLCAELDRTDILRLSPPGFGAPIPDGFGCTVTAYRDWLVAELETLGEPVDLVGHDIGGSTVVYVAMTRPDLLRTWVSDSLGVFDPDYVWHDLAQQWQTPETGEKSVADLMGGTLTELTERTERTERTGRMVARGIDRRIAARLAAAQGPHMGQAILAFYRSAIQPVMAELGQNLRAAAARPGLAIIGTDDHFVGSQYMRRRSAARAGAGVATLNGLGHWWMVQGPVRSARALTSFLGRTGPEPPDGACVAEYGAARRRQPARGEVHLLQVAGVELAVEEQVLSGCVRVTDSLARFKPGGLCGPAKNRGAPARVRFTPSSRRRAGRGAFGRRRRRWGRRPGRSASSWSLRS